MPLIRWTRYPRDLEGVWLAIDDIGEVIDRMHVADEVAMKVEESLRRRRRVELTMLQKTGAGVLGGVTLADLVLQLLHSAGHG